MKSVEQAAVELADSIKIALAEHLPQTKGYSVEVALYENKRRKRRDASRNSWRPGQGEIRIFFGAPVSTQDAQEMQEGHDESMEGSTNERMENPIGELTDSSLGTPEMTVSSSLSGRTKDSFLFKELLPVEVDALIESLDRAERRPGFQFVALTWFRDKWFPVEDSEALSTLASPDALLRDTIEKGVVSTSRVANPFAREYPVTAIRLNRQHPQVIAVLGDPVGASPSFRPADIKGEPLSNTVIRDRR